MRKFLFLFIVASILFIVTACGGGKDKDSTLERVQESEKIRIGFEGTFRPFNFLDENDSYTGFDVDISNEIANRMGVETEFIATSWDSLIGGIKADKFDVIIAQMTVTEDRKKSVDFTDPYVVTGSVLITREDTDHINELEDIAGEKVGTGSGTTFAEVAESVEGADITLYKTVNDYIQDLLNNRVDVIINDQLLMSYNIQEEGLPVKIVSDILNKDEIAMAVKKGNEDFVDELNKHLQDMIDDGTYDEIYKSWFDSEPLVK